MVMMGKSGFLRAALVVLLAVLSWELPVLAQDVRVAAKVDKSNITIGDWITLHMEVTGPADLSVTWPSFSEAPKGFEVVRADKPATAKTDSDSTTSMDVVFTAFEEGKFAIPPQTIRYSTTKDPTQKTLETTAIQIAVHSIPVDTAKDIKDIKPPVSLRISFREILPYLLGAIGAALLIWLALHLLKKRKHGEKILPQTPARPPREIALEALRLLEAEKLWQQGLEKEYHARISDILRTYIEQTFEIPAMEMTTNLILSAPQVKAFDPDMKQKLSEILERADLVKFAKYRPLADEHKKSMDGAVWFVQNAQPSAVAESVLAGVV